MIYRWFLRTLLYSGMLLAVEMALAQAITMEPFSDQTFGLSGLRPAGWNQIAPGSFSRGTPPADMTVFVTQSANLPADRMMALMLPQLGLDTPPEQTNTLTTNALTWALYHFTVTAPGIGDLAVHLALAETDGKTYLVILQSRPDDSAALAASVFEPALQALTPLAAALPPYAHLDAFTETEVVFGLENWELPGTLTLPTAGQGPFPIILLVHGSGPNDRDETLGPNKVFRDLAWGLASEGIATLRYDKRTLVYAGTEQPDITVDDEVTDDALAAIDYLRTLDNIDDDRIFVAGHSLGGLLAPRIAANDPAVAGVILLAAPARSFGTVLADQMNYINNLPPGQTPPESQALYNQMTTLAEQLVEIENGADPATVLADNPAAVYFASVLEIDQISTAASLSQPILVLQGERDYQITMTDFALWQNALADHPDATFISYPTLHHTFMATGELTRQAIPSDYLDPAFLDPAPISDIAAWIQAR